MNTATSKGGYCFATAEEAEAAANAEQERNSIRRRRSGRMNGILPGAKNRLIVEF